MSLRNRLRSTSEPPQPPFIELSRLMAVALFQDAKTPLKYRAQACPNGPWEADWAPVNNGSYRVMGTGWTRDGQIAIAAQTQPGHVELIVEAADEGTDRKRAAGATVWNPPIDLGAPGATFVQLVLGRDGAGRMEIFGLDDNFNVWWMFQNPDRTVEKKVTITPPGTKKPITVTVEELAPAKPPWSPWVKLAGARVGYISLANNCDGRIAIFGLTAAGGQPVALTYNEQTKATALKPADWSGWTPLATDAALPLAWLATALDTDGAINAIFVDGTGQVARTRQVPPTSRTWSRASRPGLVYGRMMNVAAGIDTDGDLNMAATAADGPIFANQQVSVADAQWSGWAPIMSAQGIGTLTLDFNADGRLTLFRRDELGSLTAVSQVAVNATEWEAQWTELAAKGVLAVSIVRDLTPGTPPASA